MNFDKIKNILKSIVIVDMIIPVIDAILKGKAERPTIPSTASFSDFEK